MQPSRAVNLPTLRATLGVLVAAGVGVILLLPAFGWLASDVRAEWTSGIHQLLATPQIFLPLALNRDMPPPPPTASATSAVTTTATVTPSATVTGTATVTATATATGSATATVTATATPTTTSPHGEVVLQIATYGGLTLEGALGYIPSMTPWFTLYEDGHYIRIPGGPETGEFSLLSGELPADEHETLVARLSDEIEFFDLPERPEPMVCVTDGPNDYVHVSVGDRSHRITVYGLSWFDEPTPDCPEPDERLVALANLIDELATPLTGGEAPLTIQRGTIVAREYEVSDPDAPSWPVAGITLANLPEVAGGMRADKLEGEQARAVTDAIAAEASAYARSSHFLEGDAGWFVGFRIEFDGWNAYNPATFGRLGEPPPPDWP